MTSNLAVLGDLTVVNPNDKLVDLFLSNFSSPDTRTTYKFAINQLRRFLSDKPLIEVDVEDALTFRASMTGKPATQFTRWVGISSFYKWLMVAGYIVYNPFLAVRGPRRTKNRAPVVPSDDQMRLLIGANAGNDWRSRRDRAIVALCANGLRIAEVTTLTWDDLMDEPEGLTLRVTGKGDRERLVPLSAYCTDAITDWATGCGGASGLMFRDYVHRESPMTTDQVRAAFGRIAKMSGVNGMSPHKLRAHYATRLIRAGADVFSVQQLMGHEDISTTQIYVRLNLTDLRKAVSLDNLR